MMMRMAMIVMVMIAMVVVAAVSVRMMVVTLVMLMIVAVVIAMSASDVRAAFRIERGFDLDHAGAESPHHLFDHVVTADTQMFSRDLHRQVAIAEMPGEPHHLPGIDAAKLD